ncbi:MAG: hypothetical protein LQ338_006763, partial [Usnochroma carphineum]
YLHLTKRFGIIAASQLPLHYLLAVKTSYSPISLLTQLSHEELNPYHRALGRILLLFFSLHACFYLNFYIQKHLLLKRIRDTDVILGLAAITCFLILGSTSLARIREKNYLLFFVVHVALSIAVLPILYFHVSHLRAYILESAIIYIVLILQRNLSQTRAPNCTLTQLPSTSLISITIPLTPSLSNRHFHPGQHIYLALPTPLLNSAPHEKLRLNPFTIANLPHQDGHIRLILRTLNGTTNLLSNMASDPKSPSPTTAKITTDLLIEGPYGAGAFPNLLAFTKILLVAGGVGATFTIPIFRDLLDRGFEVEKLSFHWSVRTLADARWGVRYLMEGGRSVYVTGASGARGLKPEGEGENEEEEGMELQGLMTRPHDNSSRSLDVGDDVEDVDLPNNITLSHSRPDFRAIVHGIFTDGPTPPEDVAILVCGPRGMGAALRREVGVWVRRGRRVWWHAEEFGW